MKPTGTKILRIRGISIYIHSSWWFIFALLSYSLSTGIFPQYYPNMSASFYWLTGIAAAFLLFASVLLHELSHSFVAKAGNIKVESITLFFFGGVASLPSEDVKPKTEFWMALAGPVFSLVLGAVLYLINQLNLPIALEALTFYLYQINIVLAVFNLVPAYPLDGGRVFRAVLTMFTKDALKSTRIAAAGGRIFAAILIMLGAVEIFSGKFGGLWLIFIGGFLWLIAKASVQQMGVKSILASVPLQKLIQKSYKSISLTKNIDYAISFCMKAEQDGFIVKNGYKFVGIFDMHKSSAFPRSVWKNVSVAEAMIPAHQLNALGKRSTTYDAMRLFESQGVSLLPVIENGRIVGIVTRHRLTHYLELSIRYKA